MLATVTERTARDRHSPALNQVAKRRDIAAQFLAESVLLSSTGGLIGIVLGVGLSMLVAKPKRHAHHYSTLVADPWLSPCSIGVGPHLRHLSGKAGRPHGSDRGDLPSSVKRAESLSVL